MCQQRKFRPKITFRDTCKIKTFNYAQELPDEDSQFVCISESQRITKWSQWKCKKTCGEIRQRRCAATAIQKRCQRQAPDDLQFLNRRNCGYRFRLENFATRKLFDSKTFNHQNVIQQSASASPDTDATARLFSNVSFSCDVCTDHRSRMVSEYQQKRHRKKYVGWVWDVSEPGRIQCLHKSGGIKRKWVRYKLGFATRRGWFRE